MPTFSPTFRNENAGGATIPDSGGDESARSARDREPFSSRHGDGRMLSLVEKLCCQAGFGIGGGVFGEADCVAPPALFRRRVPGSREMPAKISGYAPNAGAHTLETREFGFRRKTEPSSRMPQFLPKPGGGRSPDA